MTFFGNASHDWEALKRLAEAAGDWELYEFAKLMEREEAKWNAPVKGAY